MFDILHDSPPPSPEDKLYKHKIVGMQAVGLALKPAIQDIDIVVPVRAMAADNMKFYNIMFQPPLLAVLLLSHSLARGLVSPNISTTCSHVALGLTYQPGLRESFPQLKD